MCAPQWRLYFPVYENDRHIYNIYIKGGWTSLTQELITGVWREPGRDDAASPWGLLGLAGSAPATTSFFCNLIRFLFDCTDLPKGSFFCSVELEVLCSTFSFLFCFVRVGFHRPVACSDGQLLLPLHRSPVFCTTSYNLLLLRCK